MLNEVGIKLLAYIFLPTKYRMLFSSKSLLLFASCVTLFCKRTGLVPIACGLITHFTAANSVTQISCMVCVRLKVFSFILFIDQKMKIVGPRPRIKTPAVCLCVADIRCRRNSINLTSGKCRHIMYLMYTQSDVM